ncbi:MAG: hypothetical protein AAGA08_13570 [Pseudomonadota bacterium]
MTDLNLPQHSSGALPLDAFLQAFDALPFGASEGVFEGRRYIATKSALAAGNAQKLVAEELGGNDYVSLNLYRLQTGPVLKPCEMPKAKVMAFVAGFQPSPSDSAR